MRRSPRAQRRKGFAVCTLPDFTTLSSNPFLEALIDNTQTPPDEQAAFRIDFPAWIKTHSDRNRRLIEDLMLGERTFIVAAKYGLSAARISQLRREFQVDWLRFIADPAEADTPILV